MMTGYTALSKNREILMVGRTAKMFEAGYRADEIAITLKQPLPRVKNWIKMYIETKNIHK